MFIKSYFNLRAGHVCVSCAILRHKSVEMGQMSFACGKSEMTLEQDGLSSKSLESGQRLTPRTRHAQLYRWRHNHGYYSLLGIGSLIRYLSRIALILWRNQT